MSSSMLTALASGHWRSSTSRLVNGQVMVGQIRDTLAAASRVGPVAELCERPHSVGKHISSRRRWGATCVGFSDGVELYYLELN